MLQPLPHSRRRFYAAMIVLALLAALFGVGSALAASNSIRVKVTKKHLVFSGTAAAAGDAVAVYFDPKKCAAGYAKETKRKNVAFTDFQVHRAGPFKFTLKLPIPSPAGGKRGHHACAYLLHISGRNVKQAAAASGKY